MGFLKSLFGKKNISDDIPEYDMEEEVNKFLLTLPRCSQNIILASPDYGEAHYTYTCVIVVDAQSLLPWAQHDSETTMSFHKESQVARVSLPIWLRDHDETDTSYSELPYFMYEQLRPYIAKFVNEKMAKVYCPGCNSFVSDIEMEKKGTPPRVWTDIWKCPEGHQLYYEEHDVHINMG